MKKILFFLGILSFSLFITSKVQAHSLYSYTETRGTFSISEDSSSWIYNYPGGSDSVSKEEFPYLVCLNHFVVSNMYYHNCYFLTHEYSFIHTGSDNQLYPNSSDFSGRMGHIIFGFTSMYSTSIEYKNSFIGYLDDRIVFSNYDVKDADTGEILHNSDTLPSISFSLIKNHYSLGLGKQYLVAKEYSTSFSVVDNDKYIYEYSYDNFKEDIHTVVLNESNSFTTFFDSNKTLYVRIREKDTLKELTRTSLVIAGIEKFQSNDGVIYDHLKQIRVSDLYDSTNNVYKNPHLVFMLGSKNLSLKEKFKIELVPREGYTNDNALPVQVYLNENILSLDDYMEKIKNSPDSSPDGYGGGFTVGGGSFGGGGGGGRFDDDFVCTNFPVEFSAKFDSPSTYSIITLNPFCSSIPVSNYLNYSTEYINIFYNGRLYDTLDEALDDYNQNKPSFENSSFVQDFIRPIVDYIDQKLPILHQLWDIVQSFNYDDFEDPKPPVLKLNFDKFVPGIGEVSAIDFSFYEQFRPYIFFFTQLSCLLVVLYKSFKIIASYFGGGN